ncbi:MAG: dihydroorotate oxidase, partial [Sphaerochaetaceae bacterium]|nr:dihydroorotate oxidase [Sphaerochaetaceae bacterium]
MSKISTTYMGLELKNPIIVGSSPLTSTLEGLKKCEDAGAGAVVVKSIFEEQIDQDSAKMIK